jgi:glycosyltransferase involved in cell wall biosynthesis
MRILQLAPLWETVPPPGYGGTESVVHLLTEELMRRGHDVTLAASGDSTTSARLSATYHRSLRRAEDLRDRNPYDWMHIATALRRGRKYDVIHNHAGELAMSFAQLVDTPMLTTAHCLTTPDTQFVWSRYQGAYNTISKAQHRALPPPAGQARFMGHVYNAIDVDSFPFNGERRGDDLLFLSRIAPEKGPQYAIEVARRTGRRLIMAGKVDQFDRKFYEEVVRDQIDGEQIVFEGEADAVRKRELYTRVKCLLMPLDWEEPFGLVMPEAMACGTPVIAFRRGSAPELIRQAETGFIVDTVDEMAEAVHEVDMIDPARCREHVRERFSPGIMAAEYVRLYEELADRRRWSKGMVLEGATPRLPAAGPAPAVA